MKSICSYRELEGDSTLPSLRDNLSKADISDDEYEKILKYLKNGKTTFVTSQIPRDIFTGKNIGSDLRIFTDGVFSWTNEELYYFEKYKIKLNEDFISSAL